MKVYNRDGSLVQPEDDDAPLPTVLFYLRNTTTGKFVPVTVEGDPGPPDGRQIVLGTEIT